MWSNKYIGISYKPYGRDFSGVDCWGLACLVYKEQFNIELPKFEGHYRVEDTEHLQELIRQNQEGWEQVRDPVPGSLVLFKVFGTLSHVGVVVENNHFIHSRENHSVVIENLNSSTWTKRVSGYYQYKANSNVEVVAVPHPLQTVRVTELVLPGTTVSQLYDKIVEKYDIDTDLKSSAVIIINGKPVPQELWQTTVININDLIQYRAVARGSRGGALLFMLAIAIAAPYIVGGLTSVAAGGTFAAGATTAGIASATTALGSTGFTIAKFAVSMVGNLLINAIAPVRPPEQNTPRNSERQLLVTGAANQRTPYEAVPVVLGKVKMTPPLGAQTYITYEGETDNYIRMLLVWGYGPLQINTTTFKVGETLFTTEDINQNIQRITLDRITEPTTQQLADFNAIYGSDIIQQQPGIELECSGIPQLFNVQIGTETYEGEYGTIVTPIYRQKLADAATPGAWTAVSFFIDPTVGPGEDLEDKKARSVTVGIHFAQGLRRIVALGEESGKEYRLNIKLDFEYRVNNASWLPLGTGTYEIDLEKKIDGFTWHKDFVLNGPTGTIDVRVRRLTPSAQDDADPENPQSQVGQRYLHQAVLSTVTIRRNLKPAKDPVNTKFAKTALKIKAVNKLQGNLEGISAVVQTYTRIWDGSTWDNYAATSNPAALFLYVITHSGNAQKVTNSELLSKIDLAKLAYWYTYCETKGFQYNSIVAAQRSILEVLRDICAAGRASPAMVDGKWTVNIDEPKPTIVQHFSPHNSWGFEGLKVFTDYPDAIRVTYFDEDQNYQESEVIIPYTGKTELTSEVFETINLPGVTKKSLVIDHARWHMAQAKLRPEIYTLNTDIEYIVANRGDRVKVTHDVPMWGLGSGRIKNRLTSNLFQLDEKVVIESANEYTIRIRGSNGSSNSVGVKKTFIITGYRRLDNIVTITLSEQHPIEIDNFISINSAVPDINSVSAKVLAVTSTTISYSDSGSSVPQTTTTGTVTLASGYYSKIATISSLTQSQADASDLFLYGQLNQESQDLIITNIEPNSNKTARITLIDYGVTSTYNIFTDYLNYTNSPIFETQITLPPEILRTGYSDLEKPIITNIYSGRDHLREINTGIAEYVLKVSYINHENITTNTRFVECQYTTDVSGTNIGIKSIRVPFSAGGFTIAEDIMPEIEYKVRLRYIAENGMAPGPWTLWQTHTTQAIPENNSNPITINVYRTTRYLNVEPITAGGIYIPSDFRSYEYRVYKNSGTGDFWNSTDPEIKKYYSSGPVSINLREFSTPRLSLTGIKYRIACRVLNINNVYNSSSALAEVVLTNLV